jgi:hypothetical protein
VDYKTVCDGAVLKCQLGSQESILKVPDFHGITIQEKNQANIQDYIPNYNIFTFCKCKRENPPVPCEPRIIINWLKGQKNCIVDNELALLDNCIVPCCYGGVIKIKTSGQEE